MTSLPSYRKVNPADAPILFLTLISPSMALSELNSYAENLILPTLSTLPGVAQVDINGQKKFAIRIRVDPESAASRGLTLDDVAAAVRSANANTPVGTLEGSRQTLVITANRQLTRAAEFSNLIIATTASGPVRLGDVAQVEDSVESVKTASWANGERAITMSIRRQPDANTVTTVDAIKALLPKLQEQLPSSVEVKLRNDRSQSIRDSIHDVKLTLGLTVVLVVLVIFLFLRHVMATIIPAMSLPISLFGTLAVVYWLGYSLDNISLLAITLAVGLVVDDAIVVLENIVRHMEDGMEPETESILREINKSVWTIGYTGQSPERLKAHMRNMNVFDVKTLKAKGGIDKETGYKLDGDYFGLPWPCWGNPELKHPGSPNLYDTSKHVMEGGGNFRANFGVEREGVSLLAADGSHSLGADLTTGYPEFDHLLLKKLGWWGDLTEAEQKAAEGKNWKTDSSGGIIRVAMQVHGCHPFGNAKARAIVWNFPDPIPQHREPLYSNRPELIAKYPTHDDKKGFWRLPTLYKSIQEKNKDIGKTFPLIMTSGRLVEFEGGGEETRSNPWLAELQQEMFVEINPRAANDRGIRNGDFVWVKTPPMAAMPEFKGLRVRAQVTERVDAETVFLPFHFSGRWGGIDLLPYYPEGAAPVVRGEAINTATTYGYDSVTMMQETKTTVCQIEKATA
jgi:preprotein translocase subunit SecF